MATQNRTPRRRTARGLAQVQRVLSTACCLAILLAVGATAAAGQAYNWSSVKVGAGGYVTGIDIHDDGTRVVRTDTYGAYKWNPSTRAWDQLVTVHSMPSSSYSVGSGTGVYEIKIAPANSSIIYMIYDGKAFKSTNGGASWTHLSGFTKQGNMNPNEQTEIARVYADRMAIDPNDANVVYVGTVSNGLQYTKDGGSTWQAAPNVPNGTLVPGINGICFEDSNTIYAASRGNGVYRTTDAGASWAEIANGGDPQNVTDGECYQGSYFVVNGGPDRGNVYGWDGSRWSQLTGDGRGHSIDGDPKTPGRLVLGNGFGGVQVSRDSGATWDPIRWFPDRVAPNIPWHAWTNENYMSSAQIQFDPSGPTGQLYFAEGIGVWKTTLPTGALPGEVVWTEESVGIEQLVGNVAVSPPGESTVNFCGWDRGTFAMSDMEVFPAKHGPIQEFNHCWGLSYVATDPTNPKLVQINHKFSDSSGSSTDQGASWTDFSGNFTSLQGGSIAASTDTNFVAYTGGNQGAYYTKNGGASWTKITAFGNNIMNSQWLNRHVVTADHVSPGKFWLYFMDVFNCGNPDNGVWKTTNGGDSWSKVYSGPIVSCGIDSWNGTLRSVPGKGDHLFWTGGDVGGADPVPYAYFMRSQDGGATWTNVNANVSEVKSFGFGSTVGSYPRIYIAGWVRSEWGIWYSDDAGTNWTKIGDYPLGRFDSITNVEGAKDGSNRVYLSFRGSGYVYGAPSGGEQPVPPPEPPPEPPILLDP